MEGRKKREWEEERRGWEIEREGIGGRKKRDGR